MIRLECPEMNSNKLEPVRIHLLALEADSVASLDSRVSKINLGKAAANSNNHSETFLKNLRNSLVGHRRAVAEEPPKMLKREETLLLTVRLILWMPFKELKKLCNLQGLMSVAHVKDQELNLVPGRPLVEHVVVLDFKPFVKALL